MIRDGFKDEKKVTSRESRKKRAEGERAYLAKQIPKINELVKGINFSTVITLIMVGIAYVLVILFYFLTKDSETPYELWKLIVWSAVMVVLVIWTLVWFFAVKPSQLKRAERYKKELEKINLVGLQKASGAYKLYGKERIIAAQAVTVPKQSERKEAAEQTEGAEIKELKEEDVESFSPEAENETDL